MLFLFFRRRFTRDRGFAFLDPGPLRDGELELIPPDPAGIEAVVATSEHPDTRRLAPTLRHVTRQQLSDFLSACPGGRQKGDPSRGIAPAYHYWMRNHAAPRLPMAGGVALRVGRTRDIEFYYGHVGYHVYPPHRGRHFAERAVRLLLPLAQRHGVEPLWITCNPDNWPSRRTCERLGAALIDVVTIPPGHPLLGRGETEKCRYRLDVGRGVASVQRIT